MLADEHRQNVAVAREWAAVEPLALLGRSALVDALRARLDSSAAARWVWLEAEDGLEAVEIARSLHSRIPGRHPFLTVSCGAATTQNSEGDLFGWDTAEGDSVDPGSAVARAIGGTLCLEHPQSLALAAQTRLVRMLRRGEVLVAGAAQAFDVRIIGCAPPDGDSSWASGDLCRELRRDGRAQIRVPPLRRRSEDIPTIIEEAIARCSARSGAAMKTFTHPAMTVMAALPWLGNVAELRDIVERLLATTRGGVIQLEDVLSHVRLESTAAPRPAPGEVIPPGTTLRVAREQFERDYIGLAIRQHQGRISQAARALGLQRTNLYRKARQLGMALK